jgi:hypothetical protein
MPNGAGELVLTYPGGVPEIKGGSNLETLASQFSTRVTQSMTELISESRSTLNF